ncbi:MAG: zinc metalloprotease HtpX [Desulfurococcales archaeon]|nr:zinc metalloprotease HtpX [Desulfurococcales archaeon]
MYGPLGWIVSYWYVLLIESLVGVFAVGALSVGASRLIGREPRSLGRLKASIYLTLIFTVLAYLSIAVGVAYLLGPGMGPTLLLIAVGAVAVFGLLQWLASPWLINLAYRARPPGTARERMVEARLEEMARRAGFSRPPKLRVVDTPAPNAFAYGSPLAGSYVAVTRGLLDIMEDSEVEAVLGHELGHLKHRDVAWILALSIVPLALYFVGRSLLYAGLFSRGDREENSAALYYLAIGSLLIALGFATRLIIAHFNRLREYYADAFSTIQYRRGRDLQRALAKIHLALGRGGARRALPSVDFARALYIVAPLIEVGGGLFYGSVDSIVEALKREETSPLQEVLSTHPPVPKRLRFIDNLLESLYRGGEY